MTVALASPARAQKLDFNESWNRGQDAFNLGRYDEAKHVYRGALAQGERCAGGVTPFVKGKIANLHAEVAQAYIDAGLISEAMHELRKAVLLCPHFADLRLKLANLYKETSDLEAAAYELDEALKVKPLFVSMAVTRLLQGFRELVDHELGESLAGADELDSERAALLQVLGG